MMMMSEEKSEKDDQSTSSSSLPPGILAHVGFGDDETQDDSLLEELPSFDTTTIPTAESQTPTSPTTSRSPTRKKKDRRGSGRRYSFETVRRMSANITKMFTPTRRGSASNSEQHRGRVFWLHH